MLGHVQPSPIMSFLPRSQFSSVLPQGTIQSAVFLARKNIKGPAVNNCRSTAPEHEVKLWRGRPCPASSLGGSRRDPDAAKHLGAGPGHGGYFSCASKKILCASMLPASAPRNFALFLESGREEEGRGERNFLSFYFPLIARVSRARTNSASMQFVYRSSSCFQLRDQSAARRT